MASREPIIAIAVPAGWGPREMTVADRAARIAEFETSYQGMKDQAQQLERERVTRNVYYAQTRIRLLGGTHTTAQLASLDAEAKGWRETCEGARIQIAKLIKDQRAELDIFHLLQRQIVHQEANGPNAEPIAILVEGTGGVFD